MCMRINDIIAVDYVYMCSFNSPSRQRIHDGCDQLREVDTVQHVPGVGFLQALVPGRHPACHCLPTPRSVCTAYVATLRCTVNTFS